MQTDTDFTKMPINVSIYFAAFSAESTLRAITAMADTGFDFTRQLPAINIFFQYHHHAENESPRQLEHATITANASM
jgi:hypothetical protein